MALYSAEILGKNCSDVKLHLGHVVHFKVFFLDGCVAKPVKKKEKKFIQNNAHFDINKWFLSLEVYEKT